MPGIFHISRLPARVTSAPRTSTPSFLWTSGSATIIWMWPIETPASFGAGSWANRGAAAAASINSHRMRVRLPHTWTLGPGSPVVPELASDRTVLLNRPLSRLVDAATSSVVLMPDGNIPVDGRWPQFDSELDGLRFTAIVDRDRK